MVAMCDRFGPFVKLQLNRVRLELRIGLESGTETGIVRVSIRLTVTVRPGDQVNSGPTVGP